MPAKKETPPICLNPDCTDPSRPVKSRGVCACCYQSFRTAAINSATAKTKAEKRQQIDRYYAKLVRQKKIAERSPAGKPRTAVA